MNAHSEVTRTTVDETMRPVDLAELQDTNGGGVIFRYPGGFTCGTFDPIGHGLPGSPSPIVDMPWPP